LNLDALTPSQIGQALPVIADRCREVGRDPSTLPVSVHIWGEAGDVEPGPGRQERYLEYAEIGVDRIIVQGYSGVTRPDILESLIEDCAGAGLLG
jgi:hypothetical protein